MEFYLFNVFLKKRLSEINKMFPKMCLKFQCSIERLELQLFFTTLFILLFSRIFEYLRNQKVTGCGQWDGMKKGSVVNGESEEVL